MCLYYSNIYLSIHLSVYPFYLLKWRNKTTFFCFQLHADMVRLAIRIKEHRNLQCAFVIFIKHQLSASLYIFHETLVKNHQFWQSDLFQQMLKNSQISERGDNTNLKHSSKNKPLLQCGMRACLFYVYI